MKYTPHLRNTAKSGGSLRRSRLSLCAGVLALALSVSQTLAFPAFAGPAEEATVSSDEPSVPAALGPAADLSASNYYNGRLSDPIVKPEKPLSKPDECQCYGAVGRRTKPVPHHHRQSIRLQAHLIPGNHTWEGIYQRAFDDAAA